MDTESLFGKRTQDIANPGYTKGSRKTPKVITTNNPFQIASSDNNPEVNAAFNANAAGYNDEVPNLDELEDKGIVYNHIDTDFDKQLAHNQSFLEQIRRSAWQSLWGNLVLGTAKGVTDIIGGVMHLAGASPTYSNEASDYLGKLQDENAQNNQIYTDEDASILNISNDVSSILNKLPMVAGIASMGISAGLATKGINAIGSISGIGKAIKNGRLALSRIGAGKNLLAGAETIAKGNQALSGMETGLNGLNAFGRFANKPNVIAFANAAALTTENAVLNRLMWNYSEAHGVYNQVYSDATEAFKTMSDSDYNQLVNRNAQALSDAGVNIDDRDAVAKFIAKQSADRTFNFDWSNALFDVVSLYGTRNILKGITANSRSLKLLREQRESVRYAGMTSEAIEKAKKAEGLWGEVSRFGYGASQWLKRNAIHQVNGISQMAIVGIGRNEGISYGKTLLGQTPESTFDQRLSKYFSNSETYEELAWAAIGGIASGAASTAVNKGISSIGASYKRHQFLKNVSEEDRAETEQKLKENHIYDSLNAQEKRELAALNDRTAAFDEFVNNIKLIESGKNPLRKDANDNYALLDPKEKDTLYNQMESNYTDRVSLNAISNNQVDLLNAYVSSDAFKQSLIDRGGFNQEEADARQKSIQDSIKKNVDKYNEYYGLVLNNLGYIEQERSQQIKEYNKGKKRSERISTGSIPLQYADMITREFVLNDNALEQSENYYNNLHDKVSARISELQQVKDPNKSKLNPEVDYLSIVKARVNAERLGGLYAEKRRLEEADKKADANHPSINSALNNINQQIDLIETSIKPQDDSAASIADYLATETTAKSFVHIISPNGNKVLNPERGYQLGFSAEENTKQSKQFFVEKDGKIVANLDAVENILNRGVQRTDTLAGEIGEEFKKRNTTLNKHLKDIKSTDKNLYEDINYLEQLHLNNELRRNMGIVTMDNLRSMVSNYDDMLQDGRNNMVKEAQQTFYDINDRFLREDKGYQFVNNVYRLYTGDKTISDFKDILSDSEYKRFEDAYKIINSVDRNSNNHSRAINSIINNLKTATKSEAEARQKERDDAQKAKDDEQTRAEVDKERREISTRNSKSNVGTQNKEPNNLSAKEQEGKIAPLQGQQSNSEQATTPIEESEKTTQSPTSSPAQSAGFGAAQSAPRSASVYYNLKTHVGDDDVIKYDLTDYDEKDSNAEHIQLVPITYDSDGTKREITDKSEITPETLYEVRSTNDEGFSDAFLSNSGLYSDNLVQDSSAKLKVTDNPTVKLNDNGSITVVEEGVLENADGNQGVDRGDKPQQLISSTGVVADSEAPSNITPSNKEKAKAPSKPKLTPEEKLAYDEPRSKFRKNNDFEQVYKQALDGYDDGLSAKQRKFAGRQLDAIEAQLESDFRDNWDDAQTVANVRFAARKAVNKLVKGGDLDDVAITNEATKIYKAIAGKDELSKFEQTQMQRAIASNLAKVKNENNPNVNHDVQTNVDAIVEGDYNGTYTNGKKSTRRELGKDAQEANKNLTDAADALIEEYASNFNIAQTKIPVDDEGHTIGKVPINTKQLLEWINKTTLNPFNASDIYTNLRKYLLSDEGLSKYIITDIAHFNANGDSLLRALRPEMFLDRKYINDSLEKGDRLNTYTILDELKKGADSGDKQAQADYEKTLNAVANIHVDDELGVSFVKDTSTGNTTMELKDKNGVTIGKVPVPSIIKSTGAWRIKNDNVWDEFKVDNNTWEVNGKTYNWWNDLFTSQEEQRHDEAYNDSVKLDDVFTKLLDTTISDKTRNKLINSLKDNYWIKEAINRGILDVIDNGKINDSKLNRAINHIFNLYTYSRGLDGSLDEIADNRRLSIKGWFYNLDREYNNIHAIGRDRGMTPDTPAKNEIKVVVKRKNVGEYVENLSEGKDLGKPSDPKIIGRRNRNNIHLTVGNKDGYAEASGYSYPPDTTMPIGRTAVTIFTPEGEPYRVHAYPQYTSKVGGVIDEMMTEVSNVLAKTFDDTIKRGFRSNNFETVDKLLTGLLGNNKLTTGSLLYTGSDNTGNNAKSLELIKGNDGSIIIKNNNTQIAFYRKTKANGNHASTNAFNIAFRNADGSKFLVDLIHGTVSKNNGTPRSVNIKKVADYIKNFIADNTGVRITREYVTADNTKGDIEGYLTHAKDGKFSVSIGDKTWNFDSFNDFILKNDAVLLDTHVDEDTKDNFRFIAKRNKINNGLIAYGRDESSKPTMIEATTPVEESETKSPSPTKSQADINRDNDVNIHRITATSITNPNRKGFNAGIEIAKIAGIDSSSISKLKTRKGLEILPKNVIFDAHLNDKGTDSNGKAFDRSSINAMYNNQNAYQTETIDANGKTVKTTVPHGAVVVGQTWLDMFHSDPKQAVRKLIHEQVHKNLDELPKEDHTKYVKDLRSIYDEFSNSQDWVKNSNLTKAQKDIILDTIERYSFKDMYGEDGKISQSGLEEFLVESLTAGDLHDALNLIDSKQSIGKNKKLSIWQRILRFVAKAFGWGDIRKGSLLEAEWNQFGKSFEEIRNKDKNDNSLPSTGGVAGKDKVVITPKGETPPKVTSEENKSKEPEPDDFLDDMLGDDSMFDSYETRDNSRITERQTDSLTTLERATLPTDKSTLHRLIETGLLSITCA